MALRPARAWPLPAVLLGTLGAVEIALELGAQVEAGELPEPAWLVTAVGSGGTTAGLALERTYTAKAFAALLDLEAGGGPVVFLQTHGPRRRGIRARVGAAGAVPPAAGSAAMASSTAVPARDALAASMPTNARLGTLCEHIAALLLPLLRLGIP